jgi:hypothetical protein
VRKGETEGQIPVQAAEESDLEAVKHVLFLYKSSKITCFKKNARRYTTLLPATVRLQ